MSKIKIITGMLISFVSVILILSGVNSKPKGDKIIEWYRPSGERVIAMPLVLDSNPEKAYFQFAPIEQRGPEVRRYLSPSVKISVSGFSGSGTIVYYDPITKEAYVSSCGHLWSGNKQADEQRAKTTATITTWYHNNVKLNEPKNYDAEVIFWSNTRGYDTSLLKFTADWDADYFPIAPLDYELHAGDMLHSCGCDGGGEVAHYDVEFVEYRNGDLITRRNSPRPGRSGGGLMSSDGYYVGTCWGTSDKTTGSGIGYFTPLSAIHEIYAKNGYGWLLNVQPSMARTLPIYDWKNPQRQFEPEYIPLPEREMLVPRAASLQSRR